MTTITATDRLCPRCGALGSDITTEGFTEMACWCGSRWYPEPPPVPFVDTEATEPRRGRPPKALGVRT